GSRSAEASILLANHNFSVDSRKRTDRARSPGHSRVITLTVRIFSKRAPPPHVLRPGDRARSGFESALAAPCRAAVTALKKAWLSRRKYYSLGYKPSFCLCVSL